MTRQGTRNYLTVCSPCNSPCVLSLHSLCLSLYSLCLSLQLTVTHALSQLQSLNYSHPGDMPMLLSENIQFSSVLCINHLGVFNLKSHWDLFFYQLFSVGFTERMRWACVFRIPSACAGSGGNFHSDKCFIFPSVLNVHVLQPSGFTTT